jgi:thiol-disulfide isomerase/thioredoxin
MPQLSRKKRVWILLLGLAIFSGIAHSAYRALSRQREESQPVKILSEGMQLPAGLELEWPGEKKAAVSDCRGKVVLLNFWAGWCGPCLHEMPGLYELQNRLGSKGFTVLGVNLDEDSQAGLRTLKRLVGEAPFPMFRGLGTPLIDYFPIEGLPFTVVLDREQHIRYARPGEMNWSGPAAGKLIEGLL